ncbi:MAG: DUF393 domain-containing protein [Bacteroidales bacterium]|nr:DUF393 domain-containing protein [Bacteroidales bacterium]
MPVNNRPIIFFDGYCNLCSGSARFVMRNDRKRRFRLIPLQGREAVRLLEPFSRREDLPDSILLLQDGKLYTRSAAVLRIARKLRFPWFFAVILLVVPPFIRNPVYNWIAGNRKKWFGERTVCFLPDQDEPAV